MAIPISAELQLKILRLVRSIAKLDKLAVRHIVSEPIASEHFFWEYVERKIADIRYVPDNLLEYAHFYELDNKDGYAIDIPLWSDKTSVRDIELFLHVDSMTSDVIIRDIRIP